MIDLSERPDLSADLIWALQSYVFDSGRLLVVAVGRDGLIDEANLLFRSRFAGFGSVRGEPLVNFLTMGEGTDWLPEPGLKQRRPTAQVFKAPVGGDIYLFHVYPLGDGVLLIGELVDVAESDVVERMGNLAMEMSRLVRDLRKTNRDLAHANETNQLLARMDPLTGLANRRFFMQRLLSSLKDALTNQATLSVLMVDLDHFKTVNDRYGHAGGDAVLVMVSQLMKELVREVDLPGRLGGEEFALLIWNTDCRVATDVAERLLSRLRSLRPFDDAYRVTASIGVAQAQPGEDADALLIRADAMLYEAKTHGRNQVRTDPLQPSV
ncbi:GGDEF domain-containing protein [Thiocapsa imhoffii]|uniref:diguanylate cyclase n=1 Tax=Thiocapsa imhoffii TaxID=382777 RepID=A0A9X0WK20_9GAMM|nr:GGDEF domain-containing protein [Thiocapsa imhoffii]MBK1645607.1 GGDEF domain-containing protein [Thiocapsa imhoffii]